MKMLDMIQTLPGMGRRVDKNIRRVVAKITFVGPEDFPSGNTPNEPVWTVQADAPIPVCQHGATREEAIERAKQYLESIGFRGHFLVVDDDEE